MIKKKVVKASKDDITCHDSIKESLTLESRIKALEDNIVILGRQIALLEGHIKKKEPKKKEKESKSKFSFWS